MSAWNTPEMLQFRLQMVVKMLEGYGVSLSEDEAHRFALSDQALAAAGQSENVRVLIEEGKLLQAELDKLS